jgi:hypothetical protein
MYMYTFLFLLLFIIVNNIANYIAIVLSLTANTVTEFLITVNQYYIVIIIMYLFAVICSIRLYNTEMIDPVSFFLSLWTELVTFVQLISQVSFHFSLFAYFLLMLLLLLLLFCSTVVLFSQLTLFFSTTLFLLPREVCTSIFFSHGV